MAMSNETKLAIKAKLRLGATPKEVSAQFDVGIQTIYGLSSIVRTEMEEDTLHKLHSIPEEVIAHVVEEAKSIEDVPVNVVEAFDAIAAGADGLKKLDASFQATMTGVLKRFDMMLMDQSLPLKDVKIIADTTASAYEKIFTSGTNIHIGDNNNSSQQLTIFKNKQGV